LYPSASGLYAQTRSFGETALPTIKRKKRLCAAFDGQSDMEQINRARKNTQLAAAPSVALKMGRRQGT
jgi:hypothetical protein